MGRLRSSRSPAIPKIPGIAEGLAAGGRRLRAIKGQRLPNVGEVWASCICDGELSLRRIPAAAAGNSGQRGEHGNRQNQRETKREGWRRSRIPVPNRFLRQYQ